LGETCYSGGSCYGRYHALSHADGKKIGEGRIEDKRDVGSLTGVTVDRGLQGLEGGGERKKLDRPGNGEQVNLGGALLGRLLGANHFLLDRGGVILLGSSVEN